MLRFVSPDTEKPRRTEQAETEIGARTALSCYESPACPLGQMVHRDPTSVRIQRGTVPAVFNDAGHHCLLFSMMPAVMGNATFHATTRLGKQDQALPWMTTEMLAPGVLVLLAGLSDLMSSASFAQSQFRRIRTRAVVAMHSGRRRCLEDRW